MGGQINKKLPIFPGKGGGRGRLCITPLTATTSLTSISAIKGYLEHLVILFLFMNPLPLFLILF
jgi:hypothetical protein